MRVPIWKAPVAQLHCILLSWLTLDLFSVWNFFFINNTHPSGDQYTKAGLEVFKFIFGDVKKVLDVTCCIISASLSNCNGEEIILRRHCTYL